MDFPRHRGSAHYREYCPFFKGITESSASAVAELKFRKQIEFCRADYVHSQRKLLSSTFLLE